MLSVAVLAAPTVANFLATTGSGHSCATHDGAVKCWGRNMYGQLGLGDTDQRLEPEAQSIDLGTDSSGDPFKASTVDCGGSQCCALSTSRELKCWGRCQVIGCSDVDYGDNVGDSMDVRDDSKPEAPMSMTPFTDVVDMAALLYVTCVLENHGGGRYEIECVGKDYAGDFWGGNPNDQYITITDTPAQMDMSSTAGWAKVSGLGGGWDTLCAWDSTTASAIQC